MDGTCVGEPPFLCMVLRRLAAATGPRYLFPLKSALEEDDGRKVWKVAAAALHTSESDAANQQGYPTM